MSFYTKVDNLLRTKESIFRETQEDNRKWGNEDLDPTPPSARLWTHWNYFAFFWAVSFNPIAWNTGSSLISLGLLWWQATLAAIVATMLCGTMLILNSRGPAVYHIGFPVYLRLSTGMYGSLFFVFLRGIVAIFYFGTQSYYAGQLTSVLLRCAFGHKWTEVPNHLPASSGTTTQGTTAFFVFWFLQLGFMLIHPSRSRWLYTVKSVLAPPVLLATFAFIVGKTHGLGDTSQLQTKVLSSSALGWAFMTGVESVSGSIIPEVTSNPDLARYARRPVNTTWPQWIGLVVAKSLCTFLGIASSSAVKTLWGTAYWNIWDLYNAILDHYWHAGARTAIFLACAIQILAVVATNLASNALPVGSDLSGLFPRYFNIVRGQVLCAVLALATVPWKIVASAASFLTFLGSYVCFLSPLVAVMITDYFLIRKGNAHVPSLYNGAPSSPYWYTGGFNIRAFVAWAIGVAVVINGLAGSFHSDFNAGSKHLYSLGLLLSFAVASTLYYAFNWFWPVPIYPADHTDGPKTFEAMKPTDGFFGDDEVIIGTELSDGITAMEREENVLKDVV
ncbi:Permease, cytosine/purines, uracil, thiamine, allantoin [Niveomyces insectorum RCEF 264]|uniref:Permease, cytosine/purines, uracil, thiamine, allantoin n=1 Tax=Niveomyces insectorum RCEF 264 TaxID=1081102 RepID=A0A167SKX4_9HYPO|nr:Permease, cytosine/purines, uracil, thiamine, allantoin [Niveomyces insectorum RCEF 264]